MYWQLTFVLFFLQKLLPPLRHVYIVPFIPSGFWPRLISRLLTDGSVTSLARIGCGLSENGQLSAHMLCLYCSSLHLPSKASECYYCIAGHFRGAKYSWFSWLISSSFCCFNFCFSCNSFMYSELVNTLNTQIFYPRMKRPYLHVALPAVQAATMNI